MLFDFSEKIVIVTGGEMGIGKATVLSLYEQGAKVVVAGINKEEGRKTESICPESIFFVHTDVTNLESVNNLKKLSEQRFGPASVLINCAGIHATGDILETPLEVWNKILNINIMGTVLTCKVFIPTMIQLGGGSIVNVSSEAGLVAIPNQIAYNTSKSAIIGLTKSIAIDFAQYKIRANTVCPGTTQTPLVDKAIKDSDDPDAKLEELKATRPAHRLGMPKEIASAIIALASEDLAYATGAVFSIDGGLTAQ